MDNECPICLEYMTKNIAILNCVHRYHTKCIIDWMKLNKNNKCPICEKGNEIVCILSNIHTQTQNKQMQNITPFSDTNYKKLTTENKNKNNCCYKIYRKLFFSHISNM